MIKKKNILAAWTMVEHLSEGDIKKNDKKMLLLNKAANGDYYYYLSHLIGNAVKNKKISQRKGGLVLYIDIFDFKDVINILRNKYKLNQTFEEIRIGEKFTAAIYFDSKLVLKNDMTFFTVSGYIRANGKVPIGSEFHDYEENLKNEFAQYFDESEAEPEKFNNAIKILLEKFDAFSDNSRIRLLSDVETDATNLHSFFIDDLKKAENVEYDILNDYLFGFNGRRYDLDSKSDSVKFNPQLFSDILQPKNYPLGRFPSKTEFSLYFMQQIAVNLSSGADGRKLRSVNGPPGTGKTTLLMDIFAELVVKQTKYILDLNDRTLKGSPETVYFNEQSIGELPEFIAENGIIVASSNNGAVKNIVDELPKKSKIDNALLSELEEADYFWKLSNEKLMSRWDEDQKGFVLSSEPMEKESNWGIFSREGGKAENMNGILTCLRHIHKYLCEEYKPDMGVYNLFKEQYETVSRIRSQTQKLAESYPDYRNKCSRLNSLRAVFEADKLTMQEETSSKINALNLKLRGYAEEISIIKTQSEELSAKQEQLKKTRDQLNLCLSSLEKPSFLNRLFRKKENEEFQKNLNDINKQILEIISEEREYQKEINTLESKLKKLSQESDQCKKDIDISEKALNDRIESRKHEIVSLETTVSNYEDEISKYGLRLLDMNVDYENLQLSNPWFGENYRIEQSKLFITALRLKKQFLYENRKNLEAAIRIWSSQNKYLENKRVISAAWNWINFTIPVISSTFASFSKMTKNLGVASLGHLFIDEAGQAIPQAAVGAIMRSKYVMVVGDPSQIKPVLTLDSSILSMLASHFGVTEKYLSDSASVQTLVDSASKYGFYRSQEKSEDSWIGIPLWVHRRCAYPMFTISNEISYQNLMVHGNKRYGKTGWFDIGGNASDKYVDEQGEFLKQKIQSMIEENPEINDKNKSDTIYVITPFTNVAYKLSQKLNEIGFTRYDEHHKPTNVGTIHTFQGKEASIVFMVLGADSQSKGAARWAVSEPNMMNVAATRAKEEFYIIGDKALYKGISSDVSDSTIAIINRYGKEHPELIDNDISAIIQEKEARMIGTVQYVGKGKMSNYAYVIGDDGVKYTINETSYSVTDNADQIIRKNAVISFVPIQGQNRFYAEKISEY